ncbi:hypothetical protein [Photorhabdus laumondii]
MECVVADNNALGAAAGSDLGFWLSKTPDCDTTCKANIAKGIADGNLIVSAGGMAVAGGAQIVAATPEIAAMARAALEGCKAAPTICLNNAGIQVAEALTPGGVGAAGVIGVGKTAAEAVAAKSEAVAANVVKNVSKNLEQGVSKTIKSYGPHEIGPLGNPNDLRAPASTFRSGSYTEKVAETDMYFFRDYGGSAKVDGRFWTPQPSKGPLQSQLDSAVLPEWGNTFKNQAIIKIPKGTKYYEGPAAAQIGTKGTQPTLHGGGTQIFLPSLDNNWIIKK